MKKTREVEYIALAAIAAVLIALAVTKFPVQRAVPVPAKDAPPAAVVADAPTQTPEAVIQNPGYIPKPEKTEGFLRTLRKPTIREANPDLFRARDREPILLYRALNEAHRAKFGTDWVSGAQGIGDCFPAGALVTVKQGGESVQRRIEDVRAGDLVFTHVGRYQPVVDLIKKPYTGDLVALSVAGQAVVATPDHLLFRVVPANTESGDLCYWHEIGNLRVGDKVVTRAQGSARAQDVTATTRFRVDSATVYCLSVANDHSFVTNGFVVHNCVSWGWAHGADVHLAVLWKLGVSSEWKPAATEAIYGGSRVEAEGVSFGGWSDGSYGGSAAKWVRDWGLLFRQPYEGVDLTKYSAQRAKQWGAYGNGGQGDNGKLDAVAKKHPVRHVALVTSFDEAAAAITSGYPVPVCSGQGFSKVRDQDGFARPSGSWAHCFLPGTMFSTVIPKYCEDVQDGEMVITNTGSAMLADQVMSRTYSGPVTTVRATGCLDVTATNGHPLLIYRPLVIHNDISIAKPDVELASYSNGRYQHFVNHKAKHDETQPMWIPIEDVRRGDYLLTPQRIGRHANAVPAWEYSPRSKPLAPLPVDDDVAFLLGNYIANGHSSASHKITITFRRNAPYMPRLIAACRTLGFEPTVKHEGNHTRFVVYSATVANSFAKWFGASSETKHVPEFLYGEGWNWQALLDGYAAGDGSVVNFAPRRVRTTSVSQTLSMQVWQMAVDQGLYPLLSKVSADRPGVYDNAKDSYAVEFGDCPLRKSTRYWRGYYCLPVRDSQPGEYSGPVYNLEVPGDETYLANGIVAHNCMAFVGVRFEPRPGLLCQNSWGPSWISGSKWPADQPDGSFWVDASVATRMLQGRDSFAVSGIEGFPFRNLDNADWVRVRPSLPSRTEPLYVLAP